MANKKIEKTQSIILRELNIIIQKEIKTNREFLSKINIVEARLSNDKGHVKAFFTALTDEKYDKEFYEKLLEKHLKEIRMILARKVEMRAVPNISFTYDEAGENANRIEEILLKIKEDGK